jgi:hypothetical protein
MLIIVEPHTGVVNIALRLLYSEFLFFRNKSQYFRNFYFSLIFTPINVSGLL